MEYHGRGCLGLSVLSLRNRPLDHILDLEGDVIQASSGYTSEAHLGLCIRTHGQLLPNSKYSAHDS